MPTPTPDEIVDAAAANAASGVASATADGQSATAMDPLKQLKMADAVATRAALTGPNSSGGRSKGAWGRVAKAQRAELPGGGP